MSLRRLLLPVLFVSLIAGAYQVPGLFTPGHAKADTSDKIDGDCPVAPDFATTGRCADKCADPNDFLVGFDKETGAAVCRHITGCPYGDSVPLGPDCDRLAPSQNPTNVVQTTPQPTSDGVFTGK